MKRNKDMNNSGEISLKKLSAINEYKSDLIDVSENNVNIKPNQSSTLID